MTRIAATRTAAIGVVFWTAIGLVFVLPELGGRADWRDLLLASLTQWWCWGLLVPVILGVDRHLSFEPSRLAGRIVIHLVVLGPLFAFADAYLQAFVDAAAGLGRWHDLVGTALPDETFKGLFWSLLIYGIVVGTWHAHTTQQLFLRSELRVERLERSFSEARLQALRMQLDPHFLFNALNTISAQAARDPRLARAMIEHLADLLRSSLGTRTRQEIPLERELALLEHYLAIQRIRFGERLRLVSLLEPGVDRAAVPNLLLQPLVENAIRHGLAPRARGGWVAIEVARRDRSLTIEITDDGVGLPSDWPGQGGEGLGLALTVERLQALYPDGGGRLSIDRRDGGGTRVLVTVPLRLLAPDAADDEPA